MPRSTPERKSFYMNCPCPCGVMVPIYTDTDATKFEERQESIKKQVEIYYNRLSDVPTLEGAERHMYVIPANDDFNCNVVEAHWVTVRMKRSPKEIMNDYHFGKNGI